MHEIAEAKVEWFVENHCPVKGIVHVGANDGKELAWYVHKGYLPILAFEPHPSAFVLLKEHYGVYAQLEQRALGNRDGKLTMYVPIDGDTEKTSRYRPVPTDGHDWTTVPIGEEIEVMVSRFDSWAFASYIDLTQFNTMVIDVQGMELEVLQGLGRCLAYFDFLSVECSEKPVYNGEPDAQKVINWLSTYGYDAKTPIEEHNDILFVRRFAHLRYATR